MLDRKYHALGAGALMLVCVLVAVLGAQPLRAVGPVCTGSTCFLLQTTPSDFVRGRFYATGLRKLDDGEVQLLPFGLTAPWAATTDLPGPRAELALVSHNNILYAIGGFDDQDYHTEIYSATTSLVGSITSGWELAGHLPAPRAGAAAVVALTPDPVLYVIGGGTGSGSDTIYYQRIGTGGTLDGSWSVATLPSNLVYASAVARGGFLYVIGGGSGSSDTVYRYPILNENGDLGTPSIDLSLPLPLRAHGAVTWSAEEDSLYVLGGLNDFDEASPRVLYTRFNPDGSLNNEGPIGGWQETSLVDAFNAHGVAEHSAAIFVVGGNQGINSSTAITKVQTALIDPDGSLHDFGGTVGNWIVTEPLPAPRYFHGTTVNNGGELFAAGGYDNNGRATKTVFHGSTTGVGSRFAPSGEFTSDPFDVGENQLLMQLSWNAAVEDTSRMGLTMYYRTSNTLSTLLTKNWTLIGPSAQSSTGITNTLVFTTPLQQRFLQYRAEFTTTIETVSPRLNAVRLDLVVPPTPTATPTFTPTATETPIPPSPTETATITPSPTSSPTDTPTPTSSNTPTPTSTNTPGPPTSTNTPSPSSTVAPRNTPPPSSTFTPTDLPVPTDTATPSPTAVCLDKPPSPVLVSPAKDAILVVREVPLAWEAAKCANKYKVLVKQGSTDGPRAFRKRGIMDTQVVTKALAKDKAYYWKVKGCNPERCGKWSAWRKFKVSAEATYHAVPADPLGLAKTLYDLLPVGKPTEPL